MKKAEDAKIAKEKAALNGDPAEAAEAKDPTKMTEEEIYAMKLEKGGQEEMTDAQKEQAELDAEIERYGRTWMWEGYFNEKNKDLWLETAEMLKHINDHVLQDIEDFLILQIFKKGLKPAQIKQLIEEDHK